MGAHSGSHIEEEEGEEGGDSQMTAKNHRTLPIHCVYGLSIILSSRQTTPREFKVVQ